MTLIESTVDEQEVMKFAQQAANWWDSNGPLKTLHDINATRLGFIAQQVNLAGSSILDVGCGGGILCEAMARAGAQVVGIDAACEVIHVAANHAKESQLAIDYLSTPIEDYDGKSFDVVTCMELLEHVQKPELVLEHCRRLLNSNGFLFVSTISRTLTAYASAVIAAEYVLGILPKQTHDYEQFIKPSELASMARSLDLNLIDLRGMNYNPILRQASLSFDVRVNYLMAFQAVIPI